MASRSRANWDIKVKTGGEVKGMEKEICEQDNKSHRWFRDCRKQKEESGWHGRQMGSWRNPVTPRSLSVRTRSSGAAGLWLSTYPKPKNSWAWLFCSGSQGHSCVGTGYLSSWPWQRAEGRWAWMGTCWDSTCWV